MQVQGSTFWRSFGAVMITLAVAAAFKTIPVPPGPGAVFRALNLVRRTVETRGLSAEAREEQAGGYYQDLLNGATGVVTRTPGLGRLTGDRGPDMGAPVLEELTANVADINIRLHDFLIYRPRPNLDLLDPRFHNLRQVSNSLGYNDRDYPFERTPHSRRIVFLGDSMTRALGVEPGRGFEARLEEYLNQHDTTPKISSFELINMGVSGYRLTQTVDIAHADAAKYHPDSYVLVVSWLTVARKWGLHLAELVNEDIDLKYDFLRQVAADAGLKKGDSVSTSEARLARFMVPTFSWAIDELQKQARAEGAALTVVLVPHLKGIGWYGNDFDPIRAVLKEKGVPVADLLDTFDGLDITGLDAGDGLHPNAEGHRLLFEQLYQRIGEDRQLRAAMWGAAAP